MPLSKLLFERERNILTLHKTMQNVSLVFECIILLAQSILNISRVNFKIITLYLAGISSDLRAGNFIKKKESNQVMVQRLQYFVDTL